MQFFILINSYRYKNQEKRINTPNNKENPLRKSNKAEKKPDWQEHIRKANEHELDWCLRIYFS
ncbi:hypothetical protein CQA66_04070 [Helicobacter aurati]|uniref:Uncharacterized protein n=1 Tax=Helicobacter aurati TaxID=137778 RepID=A0A3D8J4V5_9HELI|nr:hypothetical protein CQA66_04070 [Helicobacter aurati]